ncbi:MAG: hypothetical protein ACK56F_27805, partial [bacterium]
MPAEVRSRIDHPALAAARIDDAERHHLALQPRVVPAGIAERTRLRHAAILRDAEHDGERRRIGRGLQA